jgi:AAA domain
VLERVPLRQVILFSGEGAIGKSIVELMLSVAHVTAKDWLGSLPEPGGALYFGCEDDEKELRIRLTAIAAHYGTTFDELQAKGFRFKSLSGEDAILGAPDRSGLSSQRRCSINCTNRPETSSPSISALTPVPTCSPGMRLTGHRSGSSSAC